jgi:predicted metalloendopeptidase
MDKTVDPCEDFYAFTCGNWADEHPTPDTAIEHNWFAERTQHMMRIIRGMYQHFATGDMGIGTLKFCLLTGEKENFEVMLIMQQSYQL